jgi:hypothetical protein
VCRRKNAHGAPKFTERNGRCETAGATLEKNRTGLPSSLEMPYVMDDNSVASESSPANRNAQGTPPRTARILQAKFMDREEPEENEQKIFSLTEAEHARRQVEPLLIDAMQGRREMGELEESLSAIANRIQIMGGVTIDYDTASRLRSDLNQIADKVKDALEQIQATGCIVKDLDSGLVDFPSVIKDEEVFLCWKLGEDCIRFYHRQDEGFSGRKPIDPEDTGPRHPIQ